MRIEFYGASDDLVELRVNGKDKDEFGAFPSGDDKWARSFLVATVGGARGLRVHAVYDGCWSFAAGQIEEGRSLPPWSIVTSQEHEYSAKLIITTDEDVVVTKEDK